MNTRTTRRLLLAAGLSTALLLAGCDADGDGYDDQTGQPVAQGQPSSGCDPDGFGPFSGCDATTGRDTPSGDGTPGLVPDDGVSRDRLALAARHEAGHKAVADEYGWWVMWGTVRPDGSGKIQVWGFMWKDPQLRLTMYYAGPIACGDESTGYGTSKTKGDFDYAEEILDRYPVDQANRMEETARAEAARIVNAHADQIDLDAADLLDDGRLS